jgi:hypothetical protein
MRYKKTKKTKRIDGFRSQFEANIAKYLSDNSIPWEYESCKLMYKIPEKLHTYNPDWVINGVLYESKGRFTKRDRDKMLHVRTSNPNVLVRMVFMDAKVPIAKGSKTTYGDWCNKHNIEWCTFGDAKWKEWLECL